MIRLVSIFLQIVGAVTIATIAAIVYVIYSLTNRGLGRGRGILDLMHFATGERFRHDDDHNANDHRSEEKKHRNS